MTDFYKFLLIRLLTNHHKSSIDDDRHFWAIQLSELAKKNHKSSIDDDRLRLQLLATQGFLVINHLLMMTDLFKAGL